MVPAKAGRFVGLANWCAVIVLAANAPFILAVNRIGAFCTQAGNRPHNRGYHLPAWLNRKNICLTILKSWVRVPLETEFFHMLVPTSAVGVELSHLGFGWEGNSNTLVPAQPMSSATVILNKCSISALSILINCCWPLLKAQKGKLYLFLAARSHLLSLHQTQLWWCGLLDIEEKLLVIKWKLAM